VKRGEGDERAVEGLKAGRRSERMCLDASLVVAPRSEQRRRIRLFDAVASK
jgi:hypothetical protein